MLDALLRRSGVALVTMLLCSVPAWGGPEPLCLEDVERGQLLAELSLLGSAGGGGADAPSAFGLTANWSIDRWQEPAARAGDGENDGDSNVFAETPPSLLAQDGAPAEILIPLPAPVFSGFAGLAAAGTLLAWRKLHRPR